MTETPELLTVSIDPGRAKCGVAIFRGTKSTSRLFLGVIETAELIANLIRLQDENGLFGLFILGNGTHSSTLRKAVKSSFPNCKVEFVEEHGSTLRARQRFLEENQPRGLGRLIPFGMRSPQVPIDHYVAIILFEEYLEAQLH